MNLENQMHLLWKKYLETKNLNYLAEACEKAPFFGQEEMGKEIGKVLRSLNSDWYQINSRLLVYPMHTKYVVQKK